VKRTLIVLGILVVASMGGACAARSGVPRPFPGAALPPGAVEPAPEPPGTAEAPESTPVELPAIITAALALRGTPYRNGGTDPTGFDCSGFIQYVFGRFGLTLPREVRDQYLAGRQIDRGDIQPGDLVFFETVSRGASHVGLALGGTEFLHAPSSRGVVRVERFDGSYWARRFVGARRVAEDFTTAVPTSTRSTH
jgi:cell wall-associated NlpC family hydrolase